MIGTDGETDSRSTTDLKYLPLFGLIVLLATLLVSSGAMAHTSFTVNDASVTSNDGSLKSLTVAPSGDVHYDGLESEPSAVEVTVAIKKSNASSYETIGSQNITTATGLQGSVNYTFSTIDVLAQSSLTKADFRASEGATKNTSLDLQITVTLYDVGPSGSDETIQTMDPFVVSVTNEGITVGTGGKGNSNAS